MSTAPGGHAAVREPLTPDDGESAAGDELPNGPETARAGSALNSDLGVLLTAIDRAMAGASEARSSNERLLTELEAARKVVAQLHGGLEARVRLLGEECDRLRAELTEARSEARRERVFLLEEQDRFLSGILDEQEEALERLTRERDEARASSDGSAPNSVVPSIPSEPDEPNEPATMLANQSLLKELARAEEAASKLRTEREQSRELLRRLQHQRDDAQEQFERISAERDRLRQELLALQAERVAQARTIPAGRSPSSQPPPLPSAITSTRRTDPMTAFAPPEPPFEPPPARSKPPLKQKPDPTSNPLGSYSLGADELGHEPTDPANAPSTPSRS